MAPAKALYQSLLEDWNFDGSGPDRTRWVYRASVRQRVLPYVYARLLYQYEDYNSTNSSVYGEHLYMLTVTHLF